MKKIKNPVTVNLRLFDDSASSSDVAAESGTSETNSNAGNTQPETGRTSNPQDDNAARQDVTVTSSDDERRANFENYIKGEGKQYYDEHVHKIINGRFKETKTLEANAKAIEPMIKILSDVYGIDPTDYKALNEAVTNDTKFYEDRARENGVSVETQMKYDRIQRENEELKAEKAQQERSERSQKILDEWHSQAEQFKEEMPDFDFDIEMDNNKDFYDLIVHGIAVKPAYIASHTDDYAKKIESQTEKRVTDNIRARGMRPNENASSPSSAFTSSFDVKKLTKAQRRDLANRSLKGEYITFG